MRHTLEHLTKHELDSLIVTGFIYDTKEDIIYMDIKLKIGNQDVTLQSAVSGKSFKIVASKLIEEIDNNI